MTNRTKRHMSLFLTMGLALAILVVLVGTLPAFARPMPPTVRMEDEGIAAEGATPAGVERPAPLLPAAAPPSGGFVEGGDFLISTNDNALLYSIPAVAWNHVDDEFLVVWYESITSDELWSSEDFDLYGQIYTAQGVPQGEGFAISTASGEKYNVAVAYNGAANEYLVMWEQGEGCDEYISAQRVGADGALLDNPGTPEDESQPDVNFPISTYPSHCGQHSPALAHNAFADEYLVVWWESGDMESYIHGQRVDANGTLLDNPNTPEDESQPDVNFPISTAALYRDSPSVAYNAAEDEYLVVWNDRRVNGLDGDIYGQRVDANGDLLDNPGTPGDETNPNVNFAICTDTTLQYHPDVAYHAHRDEYLVVWDDRYDIYGQRLSADGDLLDNPGTPEEETDPTVNFAISTANKAQSYPAVAYNANIGQYLVVWSDERNGTNSGNDIYGKRVGGDGSFAPQGDFAISTAVDDQIAPALAYSTTSHQYLAVWQDERNGEQAHVYGQRVWWPGLLLGHNFGVSAARVSQNQPAVAYNHVNHEYFVVWEDERNGDFDVYGQRYDRDGVPLGANIVILEDAGNQIHPAVAYNSIENNYLVVWYDQAANNIKWRVVSALGTPISCPVGPPSTRVECHPSVAYNSNPAHNNFLVAHETESLTGGDYYVSTRLVYADGSYGRDTILSYRTGGSHSDVVYNDIDDQYLVVWQDTEDDSGDVYGRRVDADASTIGSSFVIAQETDKQGSPAVAWNDNANEYLVAWHDYRDSGTTGADVYGQRVNAVGGLMGGNFSISTSAGLDYQLSPDVAFVTAADRYRVVWHDDREPGLGYNIRGQWVDADGTVLGLFDDPIFRYYGWQRHPAITYAPGYERALTVWDDGRNGVEYDVYGRFGALDVTPPTARFTVDDTWGHVGDQFVFNAWPSYDPPVGTPRGALLVRWDFDSDGNWDTPLSFEKYVTRTIYSAGIYTVTLEVQDLAWFTDTVSHHVVVLPLVPTNTPQALAASQPTATLTVSPTFGYAGDTFSLDASGSVCTGTVIARWDWENDGEFDTGFDTVLTATHVYTVAGDYTARVELRDDSSLSHAALQNITVLPSMPITLEVSPGLVSMVPGEVTRFRARAWDEYDNVMLNPAVTWSVTGGAAGVISDTGVFTASIQTGTYPDVILAEIDALGDTASVTIFWPYEVYLPLALRNY